MLLALLLFVEPLPVAPVVPAAGVGAPDVCPAVAAPLPFGADDVDVGGGALSAIFVFLLL